MKIAIVTGASSGMGKEFVKELDRREDFDEIWTVARREDRLLALQSEVKARIRPICLDLSKTESIDRLRVLLEEEKPEVAVLVAASGFGKFKAFLDTPIEDLYGMIDLNAKALMGVTYHVLPYMKEGGRIYEVDSLSAFQPVPYIGVYGATKAFVLSFSRSLNVELKSRGIRVMAVCPGWVKTEFFDRAVTDDSTIVYYNRFYEAKDVVLHAIKDMKKGKDVSILGFPIRAQVLATKLLPHKIVMRIWCKQQKKL